MYVIVGPDTDPESPIDTSCDLTSYFSDLFAGGVKLASPISELGNTYKNAKPFPYLVIDNLFSSHILDPLPAEMASLKNQQWVRIENDSLQKVARMRSGVDLGTAAKQLTNILHSASFLYLLSEITGIWQLLPDPYLQGSGYASMQRGDFFQIHSDRSEAYDTGLKRRLAMIIFLNKSWKPEYRGELEMWDAKAKGCCASIAPAFNRTVLFEVAFPNYHGVPAPLECPADRARQSFITYYHTAGRDENSTVRPHTSMFAPGIYRKKRSALQSLVNELAPPALRKAIKKLV